VFNSCLFYGQKKYPTLNAIPAFSMADTINPVKIWIFQSTLLLLEILYTWQDTTKKETTDTQWYLTENIQ